jgi:hypothetical protein
MKIKRKGKAASGGTETTATLQDVLHAIEGLETLTVTRRRDLRSAVKRVATLLGDDPARVLLDIPTISSQLGAISPVAAGLSAKSFSNIRSDFMAAVSASGLKAAQPSGKAPMSAEWTDLVAGLSYKRARIGLSRLARYANALDIAPDQINDGVIDEFIAAVRENSLHRKPNDLHRMVTRIWNEVAQKLGRNLQRVAVPSFRPPVKRIEWMLLPDVFRNEVDKYLAWCGGSDLFAADARSRALKPQTLKLRRDQIHAGVTALVESGVKLSAVRSLADLFSPENFTRILRRRHEGVGGRENRFNSDLARALIQIGREWVNVHAGDLAELRRLAGKVPTPAAGLTAKNKRFLRQFDDPAALQRLYDLPGRLWTEIKRDGKQNQRTLPRRRLRLP